MRRTTLEPRPDWSAKLQALGVDLGASPSPYWREDAAYELTADEVDRLDDAAAELLRLIEIAVEHVVTNGRCGELGLVPALAERAGASWRAREPSLYGRFDLRFDGEGPPKLLEYNADTPTALFEAAVVQWHWLEERFPGADQFNSIHEVLIETWSAWRRAGRLGRVHFACLPEDDDDLLTTAYLQDTAIQAGLDTRLLEMGQIGWNGHDFLDLDEGRIEALFKLYPWDWMADDAFFAHLSSAKPKVIEPAWRTIAASKGILAVLWELFPDHPNLLPAYFDASCLTGGHILKPLLGREGANILIQRGQARIATDGPYAAMPMVAQELAPLPDFDGWRPVMGVWTVGGRPAGLGIREDRSLITARGARFVPHLMA